MVLYFLANSSNFKEEVDRVYGDIFSKEVYAYLLVFYCILLVPVIVQIGMLLQFHIMLICNQETTFEYVTRMSRGERKKKRKPQKKKTAANNNRRAGKDKDRGDSAASTQTPTNKAAYSSASTSQIEVSIQLI